MSDHPFTTFLRILGKGPKGKRALTQEEAKQAIEMILAKEITEKQLGAFLLLMRANGETADELIGFIQGIKAFYQLQASSAEDKPAIDIDISAYAGKWRYPPYFLLSVKLLVENGYKVLLHGDSGQFANRAYVDAFLTEFGFYQAQSLDDAYQHIFLGQAVYLPLSAFAPNLKDILHLKDELGVRTIFNTAVKVLNPLNAPVAMQGIFHKGVENLHHAAAQVNGTITNIVFKGEGGEPEMRPDAFTRLFITSSQQDDLLPVEVASICERARRPENWQAKDLISLWRGEPFTEDKMALDYAENAVISTAAVALMGLENMAFPAAVEHAQKLWLARNREITSSPS